MRNGLFIRLFYLIGAFLYEACMTVLYCLCFFLTKMLKIADQTSTNLPCKLLLLFISTSAFKITSYSIRCSNFQPKTVIIQFSQNKEETSFKYIISYFLYLWIAPRLILLFFMLVICILHNVYLVFKIIIVNYGFFWRTGN